MGKEIKTNEKKKKNKKKQNKKKRKSEVVSQPASQPVSQLFANKQKTTNTKSLGQETITIVKTKIRERKNNFYIGKRETVLENNTTIRFSSFVYGQPAMF